jgi:hypothetical protein
MLKELVSEVKSNLDKLSGVKQAVFREDWSIHNFNIFLVHVVLVYYIY